MSRYLPASPAKRKFLLRLPVALLLLFLLWGSLGWPAFTPQGALRRMERENLLAPGKPVASGDISLIHPDWDAADNPNAWAVSYGNGQYRVGSLKRLLSVLWYPSDDSWNLAAQTLDSESPHWAQIVQWVSSGDEQEVVGLCLVENAARLDVSLYRVPESIRRESEQNWSELELVDTASAVQQAAGVWLMQYTIPNAGMEGDGYAVRLTAYRADGSILYDW